MDAPNETQNTAGASPPGEPGPKKKSVGISEAPKNVPVPDATTKRKSIIPMTDATTRRKSVIPTPDATTKRKSIIPTPDATTKRKSIIPTPEAISAARPSVEVSEHISGKAPVKIDNDANTRASGDKRTSQDVEKGSEKGANDNDKSSRRGTLEARNSRSRIPVPKKRTLSKDVDKRSMSTSSKPDPELGQNETSGESEEEDFERRDESVNDYDEVQRELERESQAIIARTLKLATLQERWEEISLQIQSTFDSPSRVYKLRKYHSEPDLALPFEIKFDLGGGGDDTTKEKSLPRTMEKYLSLEDITDLSGKEHADLIFRGSSDANLKASAVTDKLKCTWMELVEMEKGRYSFFDELFAMGYVTDSLEVPSPPPKEEEGKSQGEYFVEAEERHYRKKVDYGRAVFKTKHVYTGNFEEWFFEGPGRYCWEDGTVYQGEFSRGAMHGPGSIQWPDGSIYEGTFTNGLRTGWGVFSTDDGQTYAGEWLNGLPHGHGKTWYDPEDADNNYYEGQWEAGLQEGVGTRQYATGDRYIGNWSQGLRSGYGIMIWLRERQVYKGEWFVGVPHGFGKHIWYLKRSATNSFPTRHVYHGAWTMGVREGIGKMIYSCGSVYEGRWKNGQRHGKGMFINPAGGIVVGLFRAGAIIGGSDVALHVPTYECDFAGLIEWLIAKFSLVLDTTKNDAQNLHSIIKQYLPYIRKLYHRAGEYSQKYGNHGLYPSYMKKFFSNKKKANLPGKHALHRDYSRAEEPAHMKGRNEKPDSLDGVNPVTRFGLWLLVKDCEGLLDEVTMAYYDQIWSETPPISFQTKHNPFEPVYLWQFVQSLIVVALAYFVDIPSRRRLLEESRESLIKEKTEVQSPVVSTSPKTRAVAVVEAKPKGSTTKRKNKGKKNSSNTDVQPNSGIAPALKNSKTGRKMGGKVKLTKDGTGSEKSLSKMAHKEKGKSLAVLKGSEEEEEEGSQEEEEDIQSTHTTENPSDAPPENERKQATLDETTKEEEQKPSKADDRKHSKAQERKLSKADDRKLSKAQERKLSMEDDKKLSKVHDGDGEEEVIEQPASIPDLETSEEKDDSSNLDEASEKQRRDSSESRKKDTMSQDVKAERWKRKTDVVRTETSVAEFFESFLTAKLLPCLTRDPGVNLPVVPNPLPALVDMYDAFKAIKNRDILDGSEMIRSVLQIPDDEVWWVKEIELHNDENVEEETEEQENEGEVAEKEPIEKHVEEGSGEEGDHPVVVFLMPAASAEDVQVEEKMDYVENVSLEMEISGREDTIPIADEKIDKVVSKELKVEPPVPVVESTVEEKTELPASEYLGVPAQDSDTILKLLNLEKKESIGGTTATSNKAAADDDSSCEEDSPASVSATATQQQKVFKMGRSLADARAAMFGDYFNVSDSEGSLTEFIVDGHPFAEEELASEPFLWVDDYKCIPATSKSQHTKNIDIDDLFGALHGIYPNLYIGKKELNSDFIFCDWLWCISLLAKTSTEREFQDVWQVKGVQRDLTSPQSYGVYSHYIKQIKNNPYLSPTPPPDFRPIAQQEKKKSDASAKVSTKSHNS